MNWGCTCYLIKRWLRSIKPINNLPVLIDVIFHAAASQIFWVCSMITFFAFIVRVMSSARTDIDRELFWSYAFTWCYWKSIYLAMSLDLKRKIIFLAFGTLVIILFYQLALFKDYKLYEKVPGFLLKSLEGHSHYDSLSGKVVRFADEAHHSHGKYINWNRLIFLYSSEIKAFVMAKLKR